MRVSDCHVFDEDSGRKTHDGFLFTYADRAEDTDYTYTPAGRIASVVKDLATTRYAFDLAGAGNLTGIRRPGETTTTLTYGSGNRLATMSGPAGSWTYGWDAAKGWRTSAKRSGESSVTYTYTAGRLTSYADPNASTTAAFAYDATGQRVRSVTTQGSLTTTSTFTYDGLLLQRTASERSDGTTCSVSYLFDEENDPYAAIYESGEATPVVFTIITTDRGDVRELLDQDGASFALYCYDAFGRPTETTTTATASLDATTAAGIAEANPLRYAGYCYDGFSGLYYLSQRYYDPATAQFITKDPAKADGEESAYQYCAGDPVGKVDPSGLIWSAISDGVAASLKQRIRSIALKYTSRTIPYVWGGSSWTKGIDCSHFVMKVLKEAGMPGASGMSLTNDYSVSLYNKAGLKSTSPGYNYFDKTKKSYQTGDILQADRGGDARHIVLVIDDGTNPRIAESATSWGRSDGTHVTRLKSRWTGSPRWVPQHAGRYFVVYSHQVTR